MDFCGDEQLLVDVGVLLDALVQIIGDVAAEKAFAIIVVGLELGKAAQRSEGHAVVRVHFQVQSVTANYNVKN